MYIYCRDAAISALIGDIREEEESQPNLDPRTKPLATPSTHPTKTPLIVDPRYTTGKLTAYLGTATLLRVLNFEGDERIDIRKFESNGNVLIPSKKGVSIPLRRYVSLRGIMPDGTRMLEEQRGGREIKFRNHVGGGLHLVVTSPYRGVTLRHYYQDDPDGKELKPGKGLFLNTKEWKLLCVIDKKLDSIIPELVSTIRCTDTNSHSNQEVAFACRECNPFTFHS